METQCSNVALLDSSSMLMLVCAIGNLTMIAHPQLKHQLLPRQQPLLQAVEISPAPEKPTETTLIPPTVPFSINAQ